MFFITKYRHNKIVGQYKEVTKGLIEALYRKDTLIKIVDKLTDKTNDLIGMSDTYVCGPSGVMNALDDTVPRYVDDYFGGKVIKQEATPVTILDEKGKATYALTKQPADKSRTYKLVIK